VRRATLVSRNLCSSEISAALAALIPQRKLGDAVRSVACYTATSHGSPVRDAKRDSAHKAAIGSDRGGQRHQTSSHRAAERRAVTLASFARWPAALRPICAAAACATIAWPLCDIRSASGCYSASWLWRNHLYIHVEMNRHHLERILARSTLGSSSSRGLISVPGRDIGAVPSVGTGGEKARLSLPSEMRGEQCSVPRTAG